ncbi:MAG TPA: RNA methyltransferase [Candidatus Kryptonia bacterium]
MKSQRRIERLSQTIRYSQTDLTLVLENIHDPHNVSAILRTCDAVGVRSINLLYNLEPFPKIGKKSSASANKWVEKRLFRSPDDCFNVLKQEGFVIAASVVDESSVSLFEMDLRNKTALIFGNEHRGVTDKSAAMADVRFRIPMFGMVRSLNVSVACAITLYEALRQRLAEPDKFPPKINADKFHEKLQEWMKK